MRKYEVGKLYGIKYNHLKITTGLVYEDGRADIYYADIDEMLGENVERTRLLLKCVSKDSPGYTFLEYYSGQLIRVRPEIPNDEPVIRFDAITIDNYNDIKNSLNCMTNLAVSGAEEIDDAFIVKFMANKGNEEKIISDINELVEIGKNNLATTLEDMKKNITYNLYPYAKTENDFYDFEHGVSYLEKVKKR
ncbi:MAG: hypothetical protein IJ565_05455 [Bacilli bacterium]|nr:hypothetical protein [Bacilli bacterium]